MANEYTSGQKLQGIGAILGGTVPQFQQEMQQLDEARMKAMYQDAGAAYQMYGQNNIAGIIDLANDRLRILQRLPGSDPSDTIQALELAQAAQAGDQNAYSQLGDFLKQGYETGIARGYVAKPIAPERVTVSENQDIYEVGPSGDYTKVVSGPRKPVSAPDYKTYDQNGITFYREGPYAGLSVGKVAELQRSGIIANFGDPLTEIPASRPANVQVPLRPQPPQPDYSGMSQQEQAIVMQERERQRIEDERATAAEARLVSEDERKRAEAESETEEAQQARQMVRDELISALGVIDNIILKAPMSTVKAVTGPIEGAAEGPSKLTYIPYGVKPEEAQDLINNIDFLKSLQVMSNLGRLTGVLSDSDIALLQSASSGIDRTGSPEDLIRKVKVLKDKIIEKLTTKFNIPAEEIAAMLPYKQEEAAPQSGSFDQLLQQQGLLRAKQI